MANIIGGSIGAGKAILNDYTLGVEDIDGGYRLTITRGSEVQTMDVLDGKNGVDGKDGALERMGATELMAKTALRALCRR